MRQRADPSDAHRTNAAAPELIDVEVLHALRSRAHGAQVELYLPG